MITRVVGWTAATGLAVLAADAISRQLLRTPFLPWTPDAPWPVVGLAVLIGAAGVLARRPRARAFVFGTALAAGLVLQLHVGARLQSDAFYYYAYLRSIAFDGDVSFANDYRMLGLGDKPYLFEPTPTGYAHSAWTIGPAFAWSPFFAAGHVAATRLAASGRAVATDGTSFPYRQSIVIAGLVYALLGWWFILRLCETWFSRRVAAGSVALLAGGSFMLWYTLVEPTMTHAPSMAAVAGFLLYWSRTRQERSLRGWLLLGVIAGAMTLLRWQNALFAIVPAVDALAALAAAHRQRDRQALLATLRGGLVFTAAAAVVCLPQMVAWRSIYGTWLAVSPVGPRIRLTEPELLLTVFSSRNGLVAMSPILYVALVGLARFAWRHRADGVPLVLATLVMIWFNASIQDWWGSDGYGPRRFDGVVPIAALGLCAAIDGLRRLLAARPAIAIVAGAGALVAWNLTLMTAAQRGVVRLGEAVSYREVGGTQARIWHAWVGHPFSYPANLWFALANGVSPAEYDLLAPALFLGDSRLPTGRIDIGTDDALLLGDGWYPAERDGTTTFRWASRSAGLLVPLARTAPLVVEVRARAFSFAGAQAQRLTLHTPTRSLPPMVSPPEWTTLSFETGPGDWHTGLNRARLTFDWEARPSDVGLGADGRALAGAVDVFRVTIR